MNKVVLKKRNTKTIVLPESGAEVVIYSSLIMQDFANIKKSGSDIENSIHILSKLIKSWNIYGSDDAEEVLEINYDNVGRLPVKDLTELTTLLGEFVTEEKKE